MCIQGSNAGTELGAEKYFSAKGTSEQSRWGGRKEAQGHGIRGGGMPRQRPRAGSALGALEAEQGGVQDWSGASCEGSQRRGVQAGRQGAKGFTGHSGRDRAFAMKEIGSQEHLQQRSSMGLPWQQRLSSCSLRKEPGWGSWVAQ